MKYWDDCDAAYIGWGDRCGQEPVAVYDYELLVQVFVDRGMTDEEAREWIDFNILGAYIGRDTPLVLFRGRYE